jgi:hypothetical protein
VAVTLTASNVRTRNSKNTTAADHGSVVPVLSFVVFVASDLLEQPNHPKWSSINPVMINIVISVSIFLLGFTAYTLTGFQGVLIVIFGYALGRIRQASLEADS